MQMPVQIANRPKRHNGAQLTAVPPPIQSILCRDQRAGQRTVRNAQNVQFGTTLPTCGALIAAMSGHCRAGQMLYSRSLAGP
jgi:signal recognition particle GTPase